MQTTNNWPKIFAIGTAVVLLASVAYWAVVYRVGSPEEKRLSEQERVAAIIQEGDPARCAEARGFVIGGVDYETVCKNNIAQQKALSSFDLTACDNVDGVLVRSDICKMEAITAALKKNHSLGICQNITDKAMKNFCTSSYWSDEAVAQKNPALCQNAAQERRAPCEAAVLVDDAALQGARLGCARYSGEAKKACSAFLSAAYGEGKTENQRLEACALIFIPELSSMCVALVTSS